ncbi:MAG: hypothetical protein ACOYVG_16150 [Bacteroidota bacterium]
MNNASGFTISKAIGLFSFSRNVYRKELLQWVSNLLQHNSRLDKPVTDL